jgi:GNAT superfamily N-acetyltransferase
MQIDIRPATKTDAAELSRLLTELGHPTTTDEILERWEAWEAAGNCALVAGGEGSSLVGAATLHRRVSLHRPAPVGRITALVVDETVQGQGVGRALVAAAEETLSALGCGVLEVTSHARHTEIYPFYEHLGYEQTGVRFAKVLGAS